MKSYLLESTPEQFAAWLSQHDMPAYRARQVFQWVAQRRVDSFEAMSDLPKPTRSLLEENWQVFSTQVAHQDLADDGTAKLLLDCDDGKRVECVLMRQEHRRTVCVSTQVGCAMGCVFCASGLLGVERNLSRSEIIEQVLRCQHTLPEGERVSHIVVMGMGESLANLENLVPALEWICSKPGLGLSQRRVTISTVGLPEKMKRLAELDRQYHLAVSLHAAREEVRDKLVPVNQRIGLNAVMEAADAYFQKTGRQVTFEYVMLSGVNDTMEDAVALGRLMARRKAHVNLIPFNPVPGLPYRRPSREMQLAFVERLQDMGVSVTIRRTKGRPIDAACGQLRRRFPHAVPLTE